MNKFVTTALAVAAAGTLSHADPGDNDWLELDDEINSLASALTPAQDGMGWTALIRVYFDYSSDDVGTFIAVGGADNDVSGVSFRDVDVALWGSVGDFGWRISTDIDANDGGIGGGSVVSSSGGGIDIILEDAYVYWDCGEYFTLTMGQQRPHVLYGQSIDPENQLFIDRSALSSAFDFWDSGLEASGAYEDFTWWAGIFDGAAETSGHPAGGSESDHIITLRVEWDYGEGAGPVQGALGANDELNFTVGGSYVNDDTATDPVMGNDDVNMYALDVSGNYNEWGFGGEIAKLDEDVGATGGLFTSADFGYGNASSAPLFGELAAVSPDDTTPYNLFGSYLINPEWEVGIRYEDTDNDSDTTILSLVVNWYHSGHNAMWQAQWSDFDSDSGATSPLSAIDGSIVMIGVVVGASR